VENLTRLREAAEVALCLMKVTFEFTATDLADVAERTVNRSRVVQSWRLQGRIVWAVLVGAFVYAFTSGEDPLPRATLAVVSSVALAALRSKLIRPTRSKPRMLKYYREQLGGDGPFVCDVELLPSGLLTRQFGSENKHSWSQVASVEEVLGGIEFLYPPMGVLLVRDRAFSTPQVRQEFLRLARQYVLRPAH
jgi:hypothetical protein